MTKDPVILFRHIIDSIDSISLYLENSSESDFIKDQEKQDAVVRRLEIIGEAVGNLPESVRSKFDDIEWRKIIAMRNILAHEYFGVDLKLIWNVVKNRLPELREAIIKFLE